MNMKKNRTTLLRWFGLVMLLVLTAVACASADEIPQQIEVDVQELSAVAQNYVEMSEEMLAEQLNIDADMIRLESITEPVTEDGTFTIRLAVGDQVYELQGLNNEVLIIPDLLPPMNEVIDGVVIDVPTDMSLYSSADLVFRLEDVGATVNLPTELEPAANVFSVPGQYINVGNARLQVYIYDSPQQAGMDAARITDGGYTIEPLVEGGPVVAMDWMSTPHFYLFGNIIVLYVGEDPATLSLLESVLGPPLFVG